jgi:uncharacterized membrane protein YjgN (DUF898 family)
MGGDIANAEGAASGETDASTPPPAAASSTADGGGPPAAGTKPPLPGVRFEFTGSGGEYFRIWIVNLALTIVTLGIYSPWAKVRKLRYFWRNTRVGDHAFDFHGRPLAILRGRILAVALLAAYTLSFRLSKVAALAMIAVLCAAGPWLFLKSQQFKFRNSSHRGLRFGFTASVAEAYKAALPPLVLYFSTTVVTLLAGAQSGQLVVAVFATIALTSALVPLLHRRLKAFQHNHATYGTLRFAFTARTRTFYAIYLKASGIGLVAGGVGLAILIAMDKLASAVGSAPFTTVVAAIAFVAYAITLGLVWPFSTAKLQQAIWPRTTAPGVGFATDIRAARLMLIVLRYAGLTLVTLGLYWPFAAVSVARYRIDSMRLLATVAPADVHATDTDAVTAFGDAAADAFGIDFGL